MRSRGPGTPFRTDLPNTVCTELSELSNVSCMSEVPRQKLQFACDLESSSLHTTLHSQPSNTSPLLSLLAFSCVHCLPSHTPQSVISLSLSPIHSFPKFPFLSIISTLPISTLSLPSTGHEEPQGKVAEWIVKICISNLFRILVPNLYHQP